MISRRLATTVAVVSLCLAVAQRVFALEPPTREQVERYRRDGTLAARAEQARRYGNHKVRPDLVRKMTEKLTGRLPAPALAPGGEGAFAPPPDRQGLPTTGTNKMLVFLIDFPDYPHTNELAAVSNRLFGAGTPSEFPEESLKQYYLRSSYGKLTLEGSVLGWYTMANNRAWYTNTYGEDNFANAKIIEEVARHYDATHDYSQYDNDSDGEIDYFAVIWSGPHGEWSSFWWGKKWSLYSTNMTLDGVRFYDFSWQWETYNYPSGTYDAEVIIHETGHALGLPDYYDYNVNIGPDGGVGDLDMMDANWGDHNAFSKFLLDWLTPTVVTGALHGANLRPSGFCGDAVMIMPGLTGATTFAEFFIAQNRYRVGNDTNFPSNGMLIWHVDARLDGGDFAYDNSYTEHKLLRLMEADGLEEIELGDGNGDAGDYYNTGESFGPFTGPSSMAYDGSDTMVAITNIVQSGTNLTADFTVNQVLPPHDPQLLLSITNPPSSLDVGFSATNYTLQGTCGTSVVGQLRWTNALTGGNGTLSAGSGWTLPGVALDIGTNRITVTGTNRPSRWTTAADSATNSAYADGWQQRDDGGTGFAPWAVVTNANANLFRATLAANTNMDIAPVAWGLWANGGDTAGGSRNLDAGMVVGGTFGLKFENNWIDTDKSVGVAWRNTSGEYLLEFLFIGGGTNYVLNDTTVGRPTGIPWTGGGLTLELELTATNAYRLTVSGTELTGTLKTRTNMTIAQFWAWNYSAGSGPNYDVFLADLSVTRPPWAGRSTSDTAAIARDATPRYTLTVVSPRGTPSPVQGTHTNAGGTVLTNSAGPEATEDTTQFVCVGWTLAGHEPASGSSTAMTMTVTNDATLTWRWQTNFWFSVSAGPNGSAGPAGAWVRSVSNAQATATASNYYHFTNWTGDVTGGNEFENPLEEAMTAPRAVTAWFAENLATNGTPEWWLASHGWTNGFDAAATNDADDDGYATWQEWIALTVPTNREDALRPSAVRVDDAGGNVISWSARSNRYYTVLWSTNVFDSSGVVASNLVWPQERCTDTAHNAEATIYYRVKVRP